MLSQLQNDRDGKAKWMIMTINQIIITIMNDGDDMIFIVTTSHNDLNVRL